MRQRFILLLATCLFVGTTPLPAVDEQVEEFGLVTETKHPSPGLLETLKFSELPAVPSAVRNAFAGVHDGTLIVAGGEGEAARSIFVLEPGGEQWREAGQLPFTASAGTSVSLKQGVVMIGGRRDGAASANVTLLSFAGGEVTQRALPDLPQPVARASAAVLDGKIYVAGGEDATGAPLNQFLRLDPAEEAAGWSTLESWPGAPRAGAGLAASQEMLFLVGGDARGAALRDTFRFAPHTGWTAVGELPRWPLGATSVPFGHSHIFLVGGTGADGNPNPDLLAYHTITNTLTAWSQLPGATLSAQPAAVLREGEIVVLGGTRALAIQPVPVKTGYIWLDHSVVAVYLLGMIWMGFYFSKRERSAKDFFRGGNRIPWWVSGMSLFATGASAISLMAMPGKAYATDWTYLTISFYSVMVLPISMLFLAPLVRRLNISTANEYLEKRFGLVARMFGSVIYILTQVVGRMATVMLLPAIALSAITGMTVITCILIMGIVTTVYTFFGGLEAVVWTDTVQGFIMAASIGGCLILALSRLDVGPAELWSTASEAGKFHMFDFSWDLTYPTALIFFLSTAIGTLGGIGDQNFIQRVQCTPDMRQTKLAVAMQLAVAVPINLLLFSLGTALYLFYQARPERLDPVMKTDGIYPFFVAQQLPPGLSGLVVAALFAATMSTISSSICSVSDLGVQDFYRRFNKRATDHSSLVLGRILTAVVGIAGMTAAIILSRSKMTSVWDLATLVIGLIGSGVVGFFMLGLLTRRAHELGAVLGVVTGLAAIVFLRQTSDITFWLYGPIGSTVTFVSGYIFSLILPGRSGPLGGLTIYTLGSDEKPAAVAET